MKSFFVLAALVLSLTASADSCRSECREQKNECKAVVQVGLQQMDVIISMSKYPESETGLRNNRSAYKLSQMSACNDSFDACKEMCSR